jgi:hypothetical protein
MNDYNINEIDLLKIAIEGAEKELFSNNFERWLAKTKILAIELHEKEGEDISRIFYKAVESLPNR